jgi:hypothetical protein
VSQLTPEESSFIHAMRAKYKAKEPVDIEDMKRSILILRQRRTSALDAQAASGVRKGGGGKKAPPTAAALASALDDLDSL